MGLVEIDGSEGEGGGQVLRAALALSLATGRAFAIDGLRARRDKPGLLRQHLTCVRAAQDIGGARVRGDELGSTKLAFAPAKLAAGEYHFAIGTAGSTALVLQAIVPALLRADGPSRVRVDGGTHARSAPSWEFFAHALAPQLSRGGARVESSLERAGFHPAGGGRLVADIVPAATRVPFELLERGAIRRVHVVVRIANLPGHIAETERQELAKRLGLRGGEVRVDPCDSPGPGNAVMVYLECEHVTEVFSGVGRVGLPANQLAAELAREVQDHLALGVPVGPHLADQLIVPLALAAGGSFRTTAPTLHARTVAAVVHRFAVARVEFHDEGGGHWLVNVSIPRGVSEQEDR